MKTWWLDVSDVRSYRAADRKRLFKWVVFERDGKKQMVAMPYDAGLVFHMEAVSELARRKDWCDDSAVKAFLKRTGNAFSEAGIEILGGGVRFEDGTVRNFSYRFGPVPEAEDAEARKILGLETRNLGKRSTSVSKR